MAKLLNLKDLIDAGRDEDALSVLRKGRRIVGAVGPRSGKVALEAAKRLFDGDFLDTARFMHLQHPWLPGLTVIEIVEQSDEDADFVMAVIGVIEEGMQV